MCENHTRQYRQTVRETPLLTAEEEQDLARRIAAGDEAARGSMITANLRLVWNIARGYRDRGMPLEDLISEGSLGLIRAVKEYRTGEGRFSTYATWWIKQAIRTALMKGSSTIRVPAHVYRVLGRWMKAEKQMASALGRAPLFDEVADALGLSEEMRPLVAAGLRARSAESDGAFPDYAVLCTPVAEQAALDEQWRSLQRRLGRLDRRGRRVIEMRYGLGEEGPMTYREIGRRIGLSREWVRRVQVRAERKLGSMSA
jgi:RNA polymerase primary sigma factor